MLVGTEILSAYAGAADSNSFPNLYDVSPSLTIKPKKSESTQILEQQYQIVRDLREQGNIDELKLKQIFQLLQNNYPNDWLLALEIYELTKDTNLKEGIFSYLSELAQKTKALDTLINEGLAIANHSNTINKVYLVVLNNNVTNELERQFLFIYKIHFAYNSKRNYEN